ncbi:beta-lactamase-like protein [Penicillium majusculum]|nr:beta-lactamase-like protein [Penicillium majusculum]
MVEIPTSQATVTVKVIDTTLRMTCDSDAFIEPSIGGADNVLHMKTMCFLLHNHEQNKSILFDCGSRKDPWQGSPYTTKMLRNHVHWFDIEKGVDEVLQDAEFDLTKLGWPRNPEGVLLDCDIEGRDLVEPTYPLEIGGFKAHDYFGDRSFYLLDVPGHAVGHICGLARTTPTTFVFLGGDCCHFAGTLRPAVGYPVPCCPDSASKMGPQGMESPRYCISSSSRSAYCDPDTAQKSIENLKAFDTNPNIFTCLAHDNILLDILPLFNTATERNINDWKEQEYKKRAYWGFLREIPEFTSADISVSSR